MARPRRIIVRGKQRTNIEPALLARVLLAIAAEWQQDEAESIASPDTYDAAIEDNGPESRRRRAG